MARNIVFSVHTRIDMSRDQKKTPRIKQAQADSSSYQFDDVNSRFTQLRLERQESQDEWGEHFGLKRTSVSSIDLNRQAVPIYVMQVLHNKFKVDLNWFVCGDEPKGTTSAEVQHLERALRQEREAHEATKRHLESEVANSRALRIAFGVDKPD